MKILSIETSCDETAVSIVEASGEDNNASFTILGDKLLSQANLHEKFGGVYPSLAKREHSKNLIPIFEETLKEAGLYSCTGPAPKKTPQNPIVEKILEREPELLEQFLRLFTVLKKPDIDAIAVTHGPGLEPALWVGINFAKSLACVWDIPLIPVNHMEGHIFAALLQKCDRLHTTSYTLQAIEFPVLALLISGGHTELVLMKKWLKYEVIGETRDDAVGEAFDKVARMLGLPYPGGPEISKLAEQARRNNLDTGCPSALGHPVSKLSLPRPMLHSNDYDFSFSGLKTAVLYKLKNIPKITLEIKKQVAKEFEDAVTEVLLEKTKKALTQYDVKTLVIGGGVSANKEIRRAFKETIDTEFPDVSFFFPEQKLSTDNAIMIAIAAYYQSLAAPPPQPETIRAEGNLRL